MDYEIRHATYLRERSSLTPRQERRLRKKFNQQTSARSVAGVGRYARLRRRFDRKDRRRIANEAARVAAYVRARRANNGKRLTESGSVSRTLVRGVATAILGAAIAAVFVHTLAMTR